MSTNQNDIGVNEPYNERIGEEDQSIGNGLAKVISKLSQFSNNHNHNENTTDQRPRSRSNSFTSSMEKDTTDEEERDPSNLAAPYSAGRTLGGLAGDETPPREKSKEFTERTIDMNGESSYNDGNYYPEGGMQAWRVAIGSFFGLTACFGMLNSLGAIQAYVETHQLDGESSSKVGWIFSLFVFLTFFLSIQSGPLFDSYGPYYLCIAGTLIHVTCLMLTSICTEYYQFILAFGVGCGIGVSLLMTPLIAVVGHWFNYKRGIATGIASMGGSVGGIAFPIMLRNLYDQVGYGWAIRILAFIHLAVLIVSIMLIKPRLDRTELKMRPKDLFDITALKDLRFTFLIIGVFFLELALLDGVTYLTSYCLAQGMSTSKAYMMLTFYNITGIPGRWASGLAADKFGRFNTMIGFAAMATVVIFAIWLPFGHVYGAMLAFTLLYGFATGTVMSLTPVCCGQICKTKDYGKRYGMLYLFCSFAVLFGIPVSGLLIKGDNYDGLVGLCGAAYAVSFIFLIASRYACVGFKLCKV